MSSFPLSIITPTGKVFDGEAESVMAPGYGGYLGVLANHAPMVAALQAGALSVNDGGRTRWYGLRAGVLEVSEDGVMILANGLVPAANQAEAVAKAKENVPSGSEV
jgi:F-type H+-transporting ATPase subunit epsilon